MTERPILFSAAMVRAILEGRKTQTRRVVKPVRGFERHNICKPDMAADPWAVWWHGAETERVGCWQECPYGRPGDRLWVREGWRPEVVTSELLKITYSADGEVRHLLRDGIPGGWKMPKAAAKQAVTALFLPRWASRITLEVVDVRVERVQEISNEAAMAEGCTDYRQQGHATPGSAFVELWNSINEKRGYGWKANPWVWVLGLRRTNVPTCAVVSEATGGGRE